MISTITLLGSELFIFSFFIITEELTKLGIIEGVRGGIHFFLCVSRCLH